MGVTAVLLTALLVALPAGAQAKGKDGEAKEAKTEALSRAVRVRWSEQVLEVVAASAADIRSPGPEVARVKAERLARRRAAERLVEALRALPEARWEGGPPTAAALEEAQHKAEATPEYESNGSVVLRLRLPLSALPARLRPPGGAARKEER